MLTVNYELKKSIREAFGKKLKQLGDKYENLVVLDADLSASTQTKHFAQAYPERFFDVGIAEQNLITTAVGLSFTGKIPFAAAFAVFITGRAYDQIRTSVCYQHANVKIIGTHGGITVGEDGATHQALEDISLMRGLPNMTVIVPGDCKECEQALEYAAKHQGPVYIRVARNSLPDIYGEDYTFDPLKAIVLKEGCDVTLISNGDVLQEVCKASETLAQKGINAEIISVPVIKPFDKDTIITSIKKTGLAVTIENNSIYGGLGSAVCEAVCEENPVKIIRMGMNDCFGQSGTASELIKYYELDSESIANRIINLL